MVVYVVFLVSIFSFVKGQTQNDIQQLIDEGLSSTFGDGGTGLSAADLTAKFQRTIQRDRSLKDEIETFAKNTKRLAVYASKEKKWTRFAPLMSMWRANLTAEATKWNEVAVIWKEMAVEFQRYLASNHNKSPFTCQFQDSQDQQQLSCATYFARSINEATTNAADRSLTTRFDRSQPFSIAGIVVATVSLLTLATIFVLAILWRLISKVTAPNVAALILLMAACSMRTASYSLVMTPQTIPLWALAILLESLSWAVDLCVLLLLFWTWSAAAAEMSLTEHSPMWRVIRVVATVLVSATFILDVLSSVLGALAITDSTLNGSWTPYGFVVNAIVRLTLSLGLLSFSIYVYRLTKESTWGEKVMPAFQRMLLALGILLVSSLLFSLQQIIYYAGNAGTLWELRITAEALFVLAMVIAFFSFFRQMRERLLEEKEVDSSSKEALLAADNTNGLDLANYDY